jgi:hypothetical protein
MTLLSVVSKISARKRPTRHHFDPVISTMGATFSHNGQICRMLVGKSVACSDFIV